MPGSLAETATPACDACASQVAEWRGTYGRCSSCRSFQLLQRPLDDKELLRPYLDLAYHEQGEERGSVYFPSRLDALTRLVAPGARVLEVGAGAGLFAEAAVRRGFHVVAIEPGARYPEAARRLGGSAHRRTWEEEFAQSDERYDAIVAWEVVEHLPDPTAFTRAALARLRTSGVLVLSTPNARSWSVAILREADPMLCPDEHLRLFSAQGLSAMLGRAGATEVRLQRFGYLLPPEVARAAHRFGVRLPTLVAGGASRVTRLLARSRVGLGLEATARANQRGLRYEH